MHTIFDFLEEEGMEKGREEGRHQTYYQMFRNNRTPEDISAFTGEPLEYVYSIHDKYLELVHERSCYGTGNREK